MEAVVAGFNRTPDRTPGIVDQHIHMAVLLQDSRHQLVATGHIGKIGGVGEHLATGLFHCITRLEELLFTSRHNNRDRTLSLIHIF